MHFAIDNARNRVYIKVAKRNREEELFLINADKIKGRMREMRLSQDNVAKQMKLAQSSFSQKINGIRGMSLDEADELSRILKISDDEFRTYFFAQ